jgi:transcriptional regulator with XRE-family HTH domain
MIKRIKVKNYDYKHPLGSIIVDEVEIGIADNGRKSLSASEIDRLSRLAVLNFLKANYKRAIKDPEFSLSASKIRAIMNFLGVNQHEFGQLVGCQKSKVSKILRSEQPISKSQALLAMERLAMELARPCSTRKLLGDERIEVKDADEDLVKQLNKMRFSSAA